MARFALEVLFKLSVQLGLYLLLQPARVYITLAIVFALCLFLAMPAHGQVPARASVHQRELTRIAQQEFGLNAPVALFAAQIHQESSWRADARSPHAAGLAQFTLPTADWISRRYPELGEATPFAPGWAMRAMVRYDRHIKQRVKPWHARDIPDCDRWAMTLSGYNGGPGWISRDRRVTEAAGLDPDRWWQHTEHHSPRASWAFSENRQYVQRVLVELEIRYINAGWQGRRTCAF